MKINRLPDKSDSSLGGETEQQKKMKKAAKSENKFLKWSLKDEAKLNPLTFTMKQVFL